MIFRYIKFSNFMLFHDEQSIEFVPRGAPPPSGLYLILAPNNAGKTTLIRALRFLFYGHESIGGGVEVESLVNIKALRDTAPNGTPPCFVEAKVINRGREFTLRRELHYTRRNNRVVFVREPVGMVAHEPTRDRYEDDAHVFNERVRLLVPEQLFDFYFFKGEELAARLIEAKQMTSIHDALMSIFYNPDWNLAAKHLGELAKSFERKILAGVKKNEDAAAILDEIEQLTARRVATVAEMEKTAAELEQAKAKTEELQAEVLELTSSKHEALKREIAALKSNLQTSTHLMQDKKKHLFRAIQTSGCAILLADAFPRARRHLDELRRNNILPVETSEDLFNRLLRDGKCLCGTLLPLNSAERAAIEQHKALCLTNAVGRLLHTLAEKLSPDSEVGLPKQAVRGSENIRALAAEHEAARNDWFTADEKLKAKLTEAENTPSVDSQGLRADLAKFRQRRDALVEAKAKQEVELPRLDSQLATAREELKKRGIEPKGTATEVRAKELCEELAKKVEEMRDALRTSFHERLQSSVSEIYSNVVTDQSTAIIDRATLAPSLRLGQQSGIGAGGAQTQVLCLAYILSLAKLRRQVLEEFAATFYGKKVIDDKDPQAFIMDSVFAPMAGNYIRETADFLPGKAGQLIVLLSHDQYDKQVQRAWETPGAITKAWRFELQLPAARYEKLADEDRTATLYRKKVKLFQPLKTDSPTWTVIHELLVQQ